MCENYFTSKQNRNAIVKIFKATPITVNYQEYEGQEQRQFHVCVERANSMKLLQLRLLSVHDDSWMAISTVDSAQFEKIKSDQSLHVTYQEFVDHLINILVSCRKGELCISLQKLDNATYRLNIYERRSFRNLTHLCLPMEKAPLETVLYHMSERTSILQNNLSGLGDQISALKEEIVRKDELCARLQDDVAKFPERLEEKRMKTLQETCIEIEDLKRVIKQLQKEKLCEEKRMQEINSSHLERLDYLKSENMRLSHNLSENAMKMDSLTIEIANLKTHNRHLMDENGKLHEEANEVTCKTRKQDLSALDLKRQLKDQKEKVSQYEKRISELVAELEAERNLCRAKRNSLEIATEEISKANSIILKMRKKNDTLTEKLCSMKELLAQQELNIEAKSREVGKFTQIFRNMETKMQECRENGKDVAKTLADLHDAVDTVEEKYSMALGELSNRLPDSKTTEKRPNTLLQRNRI